MTAYRYKAFVSYSHADEKWAKWLHKALESYRIPKKVVDAHSLDSNRIGPDGAIIEISQHQVERDREVVKQ